jgi:uncharacterized protein
MLSNMPVQSTVKGLSVTRPEIYFGEMTNTDVYVKTRQQEFNYPEGQTNNLTSYEGTAASWLAAFCAASCLHSTAAISPSCPSATM